MATTSTTAPAGDKSGPTTKATLGLTGLTSNAMALIAPGAFLWLTFQIQSLYGAPMAGYHRQQIDQGDRLIANPTVQPKVQQRCRDEYSEGDPILLERVGIRFPAPVHRGSFKKSRANSFET